MGISYFVLLALCTTGILCVDIIERSYNKLSFAKFIDGLLDHMNLFPGPKSVIFHDHHLYHTHMPHFLIYFPYYDPPHITHKWCHCPYNTLTISPAFYLVPQSHSKPFSPSVRSRSATLALVIPHTFLSLDPCKMSPTSFLPSIHKEVSTRIEHNMPREPPQFIWSFYNFIRAIHNRRSQLQKLAPSCQFLWNNSNSGMLGFPHTFWRGYRAQFRVVFLWIKF